MEKLTMVKVTADGGVKDPEVIFTSLVAGGLATCPALLVTVTWPTPLLAVALAALRVR